MTRFSQPGVYVKEISGITNSIRSVSTSITAFVGQANMGPAAQAKLVHSFEEYQRIYGAIVSQNDAMGFAVQAFFIKGGEAAYICRLVGEGSSTPTEIHFSEFYRRILEKIDDVSIVLLPGEFLPDNGTDNLIINATISHCEKMKNRMVIIDPPPKVESSEVKGLSLPSSKFSALYYPWINVSNPFYDEKKPSNSNKVLPVAPSSFAAGLWSKIDASRGVWKSPAGVECRLAGLVAPITLITDNEQDQLNPMGVNCIRKMPNIGTVIWGGRTLATQTDTDWRYISVRRTAIFIEQSIYKGTQWAVFEPNDERLWVKLRTDISGFMNGLFRQGAFIGATASDAYFVSCGLGDTMTQSDIEKGNIIIVLGFAPLKPAEFVIVRIKLNTTEK